MAWRGYSKLYLFMHIAKCYIHTYLHTAWSKVLLERLTGLQPVKKFPTFHGKWRFITAFTSARHLFLSWARSIQSTPPHSMSWKSVFILSSHLILGLPNGLFPSGFPTKTVYASPLSLIRAKCPAHHIILDFINRKLLGEEYRSLSSSLCNFLHSPVTKSPLGPNIPLSTLFSNTLNLLSSLSICAQISHTYKTTCQIIFLYILIF